MDFIIKIHVELAVVKCEIGRTQLSTLCRKHEASVNVYGKVVDMCQCPHKGLVWGQKSDKPPSHRIAAN